MSEEKNWLNRFAHFMDQNIRGVQYGVYTMSGLALLLAFRKVRPFVKFVKPIEIPKHFLNGKQSFIGKVMKVDYSSQPEKNPLLIIDHYPLIPLPWKKQSTGLPIEIASIEVTLNGISWMQAVLVGNYISFTPLRVDKDRVLSILYSENKKNVGCQLVLIGLAKVSPMDLKLKSDPFYTKYYKNLLAEEEKAEFNRVGIWANKKTENSERKKSRLWAQSVKNLQP